MRTKNENFKALLFILIISGSLISVAFAQEPPTLNIPPTNAFDKIHTSGGTVSAVNFSMPLIIQGLGSISVTANNSTHTITISSSGGGTTTKGSYNQTSANNVVINTNGFKINFINGTGNPIHVQNSNGGNQVNITISSSGTGVTLDTIQCIGTSGQCVYSGNNTNTNFQFKKIQGTQGIVVTSNTTNVNIATNFKVNNITCSTGFYVSSFNNSTGSFTCTSVSFNSGSAFKANNFSCGANNFVNSYSNTTGTYTCTSGNTGTITGATNLGTSGTGIFSGVSGTILQFFKLISANNLLAITSNSTNIILTIQNVLTSLDGDSSAAQILAGENGNITIKDSGATHTDRLGTNIPVLGNGAQNFTKFVGFNNQARITGILENYTSKIASYTAGKTDDTILVNTTNANVTITLPTISVVGNGKIYTIKKIDYSKNFVEIIPTSSTIDYFKNINITNPMDALQIQNNGTTWFTQNKLVYTDTSNMLKKAVNSWFGSWVNQGTPGTFTPSNNTLYAVPFKLSRSTSLAKIESEITTAGIGSSCRMAIYYDYAGYPQNKVVGSDVGVISTQTRSTGIISNTFTSNINLPEGNYYLGENCNTGTENHLPGTITLDTIATATVSTTTTNATQNISITVASGNTNTALVVGISYLRGSSNPNANNDVISTVKLGTLSFTKAVNSTRNNVTAAESFDSEFWYLKNPPTGTSHITITPVAVTTYCMVADAYSLINVNQTNPVGVTATNGTTTKSSSIAITPTSNNSWLLENIMGEATTDGTGPNIAPTNPSDTSAWNPTPNASCLTNGDSQYKTSPSIGSSNKMKWTFQNFPRQNIADVAFELKAEFGLSGSQPIVRSIPSTSLAPFLGMPQTMGGTNGGTMYSVTTSLGSGLSALPDPFPTGATIQTSSVPEVLVNVVG